MEPAGIHCESYRPLIRRAMCNAVRKVAQCHIDDVRSLEATEILSLGEMMGFCSRGAFVSYTEMKPERSTTIRSGILRDGTVVSCTTHKHKTVSVTLDGVTVSTI